MVLATSGLALALLPVWRDVLPRLHRLLGAALVAALLPYGWMVWLSHQAPLVNFYGSIDTWSELWFYVSRAGYSGVDVSPSAGWSDRWAFAGWFAADLVRQTTVPGFALAPNHGIGNTHRLGRGDRPGLCRGACADRPDASRRCARPPFCARPRSRPSRAGRRIAATAADARARPRRRGPQVEELLADAAAAEAAGDLDAALAVFDAVLRRETDNRRALTGRERVQAAKIRTTVEDNLRAANAAFAAGRYEDARRLFQDAFDLDAAPAAAEGLRRVDNLEAVLCPDDATYGTLVMRVRPVAEIFVDERSLGMATVLALRVSAGRHRIRLETAEWRFPRALEIAAGATSEVEVDLEQDGFPR